MKRPKLKKASKRMTCRKRFKIEKKVKEHNRKVRRQAKKEGKAPKRKDPGVPNDAPFKESILREAELRKQRREEEKARQKEERRKMFDKQRNLKLAGKDLDTFQKDILKRQKEFNKTNSLFPTYEIPQTPQNANEASRRAYYREFKKVLETADVILEVLDARDPLGCRCTEMEKTILSAGSSKRIVLVLNKIDLVPKENVEAWLKYLRRELPTVAFKASTQSQRKKLAQNRLPIHELNRELLSNSSKCLGADNLLKLLGNYCRNADIKTAITVGVVGYPNVGKSSIINSLKRAKACNVGAVPGVTKSVQPVTIDKNIKILDCPGIVLASGNDTIKVLRNCVRVESLEDPITPVNAILRRCNKEQIIMHYKLSNYETTEEFLSLLAKRSGKLKKGGVPHITKAARLVLHHWNTGKINYYTHPPQDTDKSVHLNAAVVSKMVKEFDWNALENDNLAVLDAVTGNPSLSVGVAFESMETGPIEQDGGDDSDIDDDEDEEDMDQDDNEGLLGNITIASSKKQKPVPTGASTAEVTKSAIRFVPTDSSLETSGSNIQANRGLKGLIKKNKKKKKRADALSNQLGESLLSSMNLDAMDNNGNGEDYDFEHDYLMT